MGDLHYLVLHVAFCPSLRLEANCSFYHQSKPKPNMEGSSSTGQGQQSSVTSLTDLASASSGGQPPAASASASASGGSSSGGAANAGAATATLTITEEGTQDDVPQEQILRLSLAPRPRVTWCVWLYFRYCWADPRGGKQKVLRRRRSSVVPFLRPSVRPSTPRGPFPETMHFEICSVLLLSRFSAHIFTPPVSVSSLCCETWLLDFRLNDDIGLVCNTHHECTTGTREL